MTTDSEIEFLPWETPFKNDENASIISVVYYGANTEKAPLKSLDVIISSTENFKIRFEKTLAFRVLDEIGLTEAWEATEKRGGRPAICTFKMRNHKWHNESAIHFVFCSTEPRMYSYVIATDMECVEVICTQEPTIEKL